MKKSSIFAVLCLSLSLNLFACGVGNTGKSSVSDTENSQVSSSLDESGKDTSTGELGESSEEDCSSEENSETPSYETTSLIYEDDSARGYYSVIGLGVCESGVVRIPDTYKGLPVMWIYTKAFYGREDITEVIIGNNVQYIESYAFALCYNLKSVTIGNKVESIDHHAFLKCESLESVFIPQSVNFIGSSIFNGCTGLQSVVFENKTGWRTTSGKKFGEEGLADGVKNAEYLTETYVSNGWRRE